MLASTLSPSRPGPATLALYAAFVLSGAAGLIYESIWSRYLGLFVGHGAYAQIIVLVIFLGSMAVGALLAGRWSHEVQQPLLWFAGVEFAVAVFGFAFHPIFTGVTQAAYESVFPALAAGSALTIVKWSIAAGLILPQSILLGASFPLMSAGVLRRADSSGRPGGSLAYLYFANSIGAAIGVLVAGFALIAWAGLPGSLTVAATINLLVAAVATAVVLGLGEDDDAPPVSWARRRRVAAPDRTPPVAREPDLALWRTLLLVSFGTAVASFIYEIAWIRMLSLVLGSATHSFELMLSAFILGLALGALWIGSRADRLEDPVRALAITQWVMGTAAIATIPLYLASFHWIAYLLAALDATPQGYAAFNVARYAICLAIMLPATFCAGITLPLITRTLLVSGGTTRDERAIGAVYGANTLGSIVGVVLAGLVLMPLLGLRTMLIAGALLDMAIGVALFLRRPRLDRYIGERLGAVVALSVIGISLVVLQAQLDRGVLVSGVFRYGTAGRVPDDELVFYRDGRTATVSGRINSEGYGRSLSTNGKPDASLGHEWYDSAASRARIPLGGDAATQAMLPIVTLAHAPHARTAAVIGLGAGITSHVLLGNPALEAVVTIEIEPEMIRGSKSVFYPANRRVFDDPRSTFVIDDAKSHFASAGTQYDLIVSEPSNPWVSGVSGLFTREFYARAAEYLAKDGIFGQWVHLYELDDELMLTIIAALHETFPSYAIYHVSRGDMLIIASLRDTLPEPDWTVVNHPGIAEDLAPFLPLTQEMLERTRAIGRNALEPLLTLGRAANSDFHPHLDLGAEQARYSRATATGFSNLGSDRLDVAAALDRRRIPFASGTRAPIAGIDALAALAAGARLRQALESRTAPGSSPTDSAGASPDSGARSAHSETGGSDPALDLHLFRFQLLEELARSGRAPESWGHWVQLALDVEAHMHGGTAGVADESFYAMLYGYMSARGAPPGVRAAIDFRHGLATWDFAKAADAARQLSRLGSGEQRWLPAAELRDGAVIALLAEGAVEEARSAYAMFTPRVGDSRDDLRSWLVNAHLRAAERELETQGRQAGPASP